MNTATPPNPYAHHRFPAEIISHGVWLYVRFCLSYRDVEELLFARGDHRDLRSHPQVGYEVRATICESAPAPTPETG
jgi:hypothetical protein